MNRNRLDHDHAIFRIILKAMSRPGTVCQLPHATDNGQYGQLREMLSSLLDNSVGFHVLDDEDDLILNSACRETGCRSADLQEADFLIVCRGSSQGGLGRLKRGTPEYPDRGATVVYLVEELASTGGRFTLSGPGIDGSTRPSFTGLADSELALLRDVNAGFPLGVDALFLDRSGRISCIPRSTCIGED